VDCAGGNIATLANSVRARFAARGERHLAFQNYVRSFCTMRVIGVIGLRAILPNESVDETFVVQLAFDRVKVRHGPAYSAAFCA
jgi:hypothetical protein